MSSDETIGRVLGLALRSEPRGPMRVVESVRAVADGGLLGDLPASRERGVTLLAAGQWRQVQRELEAEVPWHTRRANVLVDADELGSLIGRTLRVGGAELVVTGETRPCGLMDEQHPGLRAALAPDKRGGVTARVSASGEIRVGDAVLASPNSARA